MKNVLLAVSVTVLLTSCVSKQKFVELENKYETTRSTLSKVEAEKKDLKNKYQKIEDRVEMFNRKVEALKDANKSLTSTNKERLRFSNPNQVPISEKALDELKRQLSKVDPSLLSGAKTLNDSLSYFLRSNINGKLKHFEGLDIEVDDAVVMINVSDDLLFNSGSYRVSRAALPLVEKLADLIKSEPSVEVMVEGHTDSRAFKKELLEDNWDLSVKRATSIVRLLQWRYNVDPAQLIAAGRGSNAPLVENTSSGNRALNRRTRIVIMPNLDKFLSMIVN